jgi:hypothetical protein
MRYAGELRNQAFITTILNDRVIGEAAVTVSIDNVQEVDCTIQSSSQINGELASISIEMKTDFVIDPLDLLELTYPDEAAENFERIQNSAY